MERRVRRVFFSPILASFFTAVGIGCGSEPSEEAVVPETTPVETVQAMSALFAKQSGPQGPRLGLARVGLDRELLFTASLISQDPVPSFSGLQSRIVRFEARDGALRLFDVTDPEMSYGPRRKLLATFAIESESEEHLFFDFNRGTETLFSNGDWYAPDSQGGRYDPNSEATVLPLTRSYVHTLEVVNETVLDLRQVAQLALDQQGAAPTVEIRYTLRPYEPDPTFVPQRAGVDMDRLGFFTANPRFRNDQQVDDVFVAKFATTAPIRFAISPNTPPEFREAVRDGILYWNLAAGRALVTVEDAPEGVSAPDPRYNMIQWVPYDAAGGAYADAQLDPRTGRVVHANVYFTSAFALGGKASARRILTQNGPDVVSFGAEGEPEEEGDGEGARAFGSSAADLPARLAALGLPISSRCRLDAAEALSSGVLALLQEAPSDTLILRASQDYIREVVAHEVGHTLGLRHNFAGSLATSYDALEGARQLGAYVRGDEPEGNVRSGASVMEYQVFIDAVVSGSRMRRGLPAGAYDAAAMSALYGDGPEDLLALPLFCTDTHVGRFLDCQRFDAGGSMITAARAQETTAIDQLPARIAESFATYRDLYPGFPLESVRIEPALLANSIYGGRRRVMALLGNNTRLLSVERAFPRVDGANAELVDAALDARVLGEVRAAGGLVAALPPADPSIADALPERFSSYVRSERFRTSVGENGKPLAFEEADLVRLEARVAELVPALREALVLAEVNALAEAVTFDKGPRGELAVPLFVARASELLLEVEGSEEVEVLVTRAARESGRGAWGEGAPSLEDLLNGLADAETAEASAPSETAAAAEGAASSPAAAGETQAAEGEEEGQLIKVQIPKFAHPIETRLAAAGLLAKRRGETRAFALRERKELRDQVVAAYVTAPDALNLLKLEPARQTRAVAEWILENRAVRDALD